MADTKDLKNKLAVQAAGGHSVARTVKDILSNENMKKRFEEILGKKAPGFISSVLSVVNNNKSLATAEPNSVVGAAAVAATLDLPVIPSLGFAAIVPYKDVTGQQVAQFQTMMKGFIQLAMRTGQYKTLNCAEVFEGEIKSHNRITGEIEFNFDGKKSDKITGYVAYFKLLNGFEKYFYMSIEDIEKHGKKHSKSYDNPKGMWKKEFPVMAAKTVIKLLLSRYGILSIEMQTAFIADQGVMKTVSPDENINPDYVDGFDGETIDVRGEVVPDPQPESEPEHKESTVQVQEEAQPLPVGQKPAEQPEGGQTSWSTAVPKF